MIINREKMAKEIILSSIQKSSNIEDRIESFLKDNPNPSDDKIHSLADELGIDKHTFEEKIYSMLSKCINKKASYENELDMGIKVEKEHSDVYDFFKDILDKKDIKMPVSIDEFSEMVAKAHLKELPDYYSRLKKMEGEHPKEAMDFTGIGSLIAPGKKLTDREITRALRLAIAAEHDAAHLYELISDSTNNQKVNTVLQSISNEEKVHVGELKKLLNDLDPENEKFEQDGEKEVDEKS